MAAAVNLGGGSLTMRPRTKIRMRSQVSTSSSSASLVMTTPLLAVSSWRITRNSSGLVAMSTPRVGSFSR
jgi:hypothetical protein